MTARKRLQTTALVWTGALLLPIPVAFLVSRFLIIVMSPGQVGRLNHVLLSAYRGIGLMKPFGFPWSWMTVYFILIAFPYAVMVLLVHESLRHRLTHESRRPPIDFTIAQCCIALLASAPITILWSRLLTELGGYSFGGASGRGSISMWELSYLLTTGLPCGAVALAVASAFRNRFLRQVTGERA